MVNFAWMAAIALIVIVLLYKEQVEALYLLATVSVTVLLIVVARADLSGAKQLNAQTTERQNVLRRDER